MSSFRSRSGGIVDRKHRQPEIEILAKLPRARKRLQIAIGRGDDAHVHLQRDVAAHALETPLFDARAGSWPAARAAARRSRRGTACRDARSSKRPGLARVRAGEGAVLVSEQLASRAGSSGIAAQLIATNGPSARALSACSARANSSLPVPLSPCSRTVVSVPAARCSVGHHLLQRGVVADDSRRAAPQRELFFEQDDFARHAALCSERSTSSNR